MATPPFRRPLGEGKDGVGGSILIGGSEKKQCNAPDGIRVTGPNANSRKKRTKNESVNYNFDAKIGLKNRPEIGPKVGPGGSPGGPWEAPGASREPPGRFLFFAKKNAKFSKGPDDILGSPRGPKNSEK